MSLPQKKFREIVFQIFYGFSFVGSFEEAIVPLIMDQLKVTKKHTLNAMQKAKQIFLAKEQFNSYIEKAAHSYSFHRISSVEKIVIWLSLYEIFIDKLAPAVAISEGIRLTKKFSSPESAHFVHAILDAVYKEYAEKPTPSL